MLTKTSEKLEKMTDQEVFDKVAGHLLKQGKKALNHNSECAYRAGDLMCAAGCLIEQDEYTFSIEGLGWSTLVSNGDLPEAHVSLIQDLQDIHDLCYIEQWREKLIQLADDLKLDDTVVKTS